jgi:hypothetical protein
MARPRTMKMGMMLEIAQMASYRYPEKVWLPFLVTHLYDGNVVSGVAFSGEPGALGWMNRGAQTFDHVEKGNATRNWRFPGDVTDESEPEPVETMQVYDPERDDNMPLDPDYPIPDDEPVDADE